MARKTKAKLQPACILDEDYTYSPVFPGNLPKLKKEISSTWSSRKTILCHSTSKIYQQSTIEKLRAWNKCCLREGCKSVMCQRIALQKAATQGWARVMFFPNALFSNHSYKYLLCHATPCVICSCSSCLKIQKVKMKNSYGLNSLDDPKPVNILSFSYLLMDENSRGGNIWEHL